MRPKRELLASGNHNDMLDNMNGFRSTRVKEEGPISWPNRGKRSSYGSPDFNNTM